MRKPLRVLLADKEGVFYRANKSELREFLEGCLGIPPSNTLSLIQIWKEALRCGFAGNSYLVAIDRTLY